MNESLIVGNWSPTPDAYVDAEDRTLENPSVSLTDAAAWEEYFGIGSKSTAGETVTASKALTCPALWQAVGMISGDCSKLPLEVFRRNGKDREVDQSHPAYGLISPYAKANPNTSSLTLWRRLLVHALIWPRGYVWIERDGNGIPVGLYNLLPDRTGIDQIGGRLWVVTEVNGEVEAVPWDDCIVIENVAIDEINAFGAVRAARDNIGLQLAMRRFQSKFFANGLHAGGVLQVPPGASDKARKKIEEGISDKHSKDNAFKTLVLRDGFKWHQTMITPEQAQASSLEEQEVRNVARFYRMAPSRLGVKESISYNSEEAARRAYHDETLSYWLTAIKAEANIKLLSIMQRQSRSHFVDYNIHALNWADTTTLMTVGTQGVQWGIWNRDEVRRWFNFNAIPGGEGSKFYTPLNMGIAGEPADDDNESGGPTRQALRGLALRGLAEETIGRMVSRLAIQARRASKWPDQFEQWLDACMGRHFEPLRLTWGPVCSVAKSCGISPDIDVVSRLLVSFVCDLREAYEQDSPEALEDRVSPVCDRYVSDFARNCAAKLFSEEPV